jgi:hypothetical protein
MFHIVAVRLKVNQPLIWRYAPKLNPTQRRKNPVGVGETYGVRREETAVKYAL